jgi:hypothetical protein
MSSSEFSIADEEEVRRVEAPFHIAFPVLFTSSIDRAPNDTKNIKSTFYYHFR